MNNGPQHTHDVDCHFCVSPAPTPIEPVPPGYWQDDLPNLMTKKNATLDGVRLDTWKVDIEWPEARCPQYIREDGAMVCGYCKMVASHGELTFHRGTQQTYTGTATISGDALKHEWSQPSRMANTRMPGAGLEELDFTVESARDDYGDGTATLHFNATRHMPGGYPG